jgi:hypothetical protein
MVNGIVDLATRSDLLDRAVQLALPHIPEDQRRDETQLLAEFERLRPSLLGSLLGVVISVLRNRSSVKLKTMPRMADFAKWVTAAESELGWEPGRFMRAYTQNRVRGNDLALEASPVATALLGFMADQAHWSGTGTMLLDALDKQADERPRKSKAWPRSARGMRSAIDRAAPNLRAAGVTVTVGERTSTKDRRRIICLEKSPAQSSESSGSSGSSKSPSDDVQRKHFVKS